MVDRLSPTRRTDFFMKNILRLYGPITLAIGLVTTLIGLILTKADLSKQSDRLVIASEIISWALTTPARQLQGISREPWLNEVMRLPPAQARPTVETQLATLLYRNPLYDKAR